MIDFFQVHIREHQFMVTGVDDSGSVGAGKHICCGEGLECTQYCGLCTQGDLLLVC